MVKTQVDGIGLFGSHALTLVSMNEFIDADYFKPEILVQLIQEGLF